MTGLLLTPIVLSFVILAAHFSRHDAPVLTWLCLALPLLVFVRRRWAPRVLQLALVGGALEWIRTAVSLTTQRMDADEPWVRMAVILGLVTLVTAGSALLLQNRRLRQRHTPE